MPVAADQASLVTNDASAASPVIALGQQPGLQPWFDPAVIASGSAGRRVSYDVERVRRTLGMVGLRSTALQQPVKVQELWNPPHSSRRYGHSSSQAYVEADVALDRDALRFATSSIRARYARPDDKPSGVSQQVVFSRTRWVHAVHAQGFAMSVALSAGDSFRSRAGHLQPDDAIGCVIERAFVFAAEAIANGTDQLVARTWAGALIVSHGLPRPLMTLGVDRRGDDRDSLYPQRTLVTDYYLQALEDLHAGDATRFMVLAARCAVETHTLASTHSGA